MLKINFLRKQQGARQDRLGENPNQRWANLAVQQTLKILLANDSQLQFRGMVRVNCQQILNLYFLKGVGYQNNSD